MKTRQDVEKLKSQWVKDPCWDLDETEGFEHFEGELRLFQAQQEIKWEDARVKKETEAAKARGVSLEVYRTIKHHESVSTGCTEDAKRLLFYYFDMCAPQDETPLDSDNRAEIEAVIDCVIDAAASKALAKMIERTEKS